MLWIVTYRLADVSVGHPASANTPTLPRFPSSFRPLTCQSGVDAAHPPA